MAALFVASDVVWVRKRCWWRSNKSDPNEVTVRYARVRTKSRVELPASLKSWSSMHHKAIWPLEKRARRGFKGYPVATVAFYGPDDRRATKVAVGILMSEGVEADPMERWLSADTDVRSDPGVAAQIVEFIDRHGAKSVALADHILGCVHEEGIDYPKGAACPHCPFWEHRDRWSGTLLKMKGVRRTT